MNPELNKFLAKIIIQLISPALKESEQREFYLACSCFHDLGKFAQESFQKAYPWAYVKKIIDLHVDLNQYYPCISYNELVSLYPCDTLSDDGALNVICDKVLNDNPKSIMDYKKGKLNALNHLKGQVMKESKGKADIRKVESILKEKMI
jgi:Asp-tRNA(Asn)/Glu-tRNA(Gln) amidotransferase B subunit